ncbi:MAG TPA: polysaccharide deacetylase family protein [Terriglobales bacterium]|jgi:peptidoglycan/xylan/chitin deacetylase (PgdA/CDA1 family)|nr:polysaccharide deacetylase family protein [Terriglobales bacterium]
MATDGNVFLMYHELELPGRALCQSDPGYVRYIVSQNEFSAQMRFLAQSGREGISVGSALAGTEHRSVVVTFDDGCETDLLTAAPILRELGFGATFYVTAGFVGRKGYLSPGQLRELASGGFEVGCHSMTHPYLPDLSDQDLKREVIDAKNALEDITGGRVDHFSCPGGQYDERVLRLAKEGGYKSVANSEIRANGKQTNLYSLGRVAVMRGVSIETFSSICDGTLLVKMRMRDQVNRTAKRVLGNAMYDRMRALLLGSNQN